MPQYDIYGNAIVHTRVRTVHYFYVDGRVKYECWNPLKGSVTTATDWYIQKYTYEGSNVYQTQILTGAVNTEAVVNALDWDI